MAANQLYAMLLSLILGTTPLRKSLNLLKVNFTNVHRIGALPDEKGFFIATRWEYGRPAIQLQYSPRNSNHPQTHVTPHILATEIADCSRKLCQP
jgi:hypothetical protein